VTEIGESWSLSTEAGASLSADELVATLAAQHDRMLATWEALTADQWDHPSRNDSWTVHETARHVADVIEGMTAQVYEEPWPFERVQFDPNSTPDLWIARSADDPPSRTIERYRAAAVRYRERIGERVVAGHSGTALTPYGSAHWTMAVVHGFWDAWLHERDVVVPLGLGTQSGADEQRLAALYGLLMAMIPARMFEQPFDAVVHFTGPVSCTVAAAHHDGIVSSVERSRSDAELTADLCTAVDSLSGRGSPLQDVVPGAPDLLGALAGFLSS